MQGELQAYLESKHFNALFTKIVEHLLTTRPEDPVSAIIDYLFDAYPDNVKQSKAITELRNSLVHNVLERLPTSNDVAADDSADDEPEGAEPAPVSNYKKTRGMAVSGESIDPVKLKEQYKELARQPKDTDTLDKLRVIVNQSRLLRALDNEAKELLLLVLSGPREVEEGSNIIVQGDEGDHFYIIEEGAVDVFIKKPAAENEIHVHTYQAGDSFGELALMYNAPRAATCRAKTKCKLWTLDRKSFKVIVVGASIIKREKYAGFLQKVPLLSSLNEAEIIHLADALVEEHYNDGDSVCVEGEIGNYFYIVSKGEAVVVKKMSQQITVEGNFEFDESTGVVLARVQEGGYFGEVALLTAKPRQATVRAKGSLEVLSLDRATFTRLLGPLDEIMRRNMDQYTRHIAQNI